MNDPASFASGSRPGWHWCSRENSVEDGTISALAVLEVVAAIYLYWFILYPWLGSGPIWISTIIAPLLLLRSPASIAAGRRYMDAFLKDGVESLKSFVSGATALTTPLSLPILIRVFASFVAVAVAIVLVCYFGFWLLEHHFTIGTSQFSAVVLGYLFACLGAAIAIAVVFQFMSVAFIRASTALALAFVIVVATAFGTLLYSPHLAMAAAIGAGVCAMAGGYIVKANGDAIRSGALSDKPAMDLLVIAVTGSTAISTRLLAVSAAVAAPTVFGALLLRSFAYRFWATLTNIREGLKHIGANYDELLFCVDLRHRIELVPGHSIARSNDIYQTIVGANFNLGQRLLAIVGFVLFCLPGIAYRLSIKSTCWLYWPLIHVADSPKFANTPEHLFARLRTRRQRFALYLAIAALLVFVSASAWKVFIVGTPPSPVVHPIEYGFAIDWRSVRLWQYLSLASALITIFPLWLWVEDVEVDTAFGASWAPFYARSLEKVMRVRFILFGVSMLIALVHVQLTYNSWIHDLPASLIDPLRELFGDRMPPRPSQ